MPAGTVEVLLIGATGIKDTELFGKADPYAVLKCGRQSLRSNVATNQGSKPVWNQRFSFYIDDSVTELNVKVLNHNIFTEDDEIGSTTIPLARVLSECKLPTTSYNVVRPSGRVHGEIKLSLTFTPKKKPGASPGGTPLGSVSGSFRGSSHGPYSSRTHPGPYRQPEPQPTHKHDPLIGPYGYYKNTSSSTIESVAPYGSGVGAWANSSSPGSSRPHYSTDSDGSSRQGHGGTKNSDSCHLYNEGGYPCVEGAVNPERLSSYSGTDSTMSSYPGENFPHSPNGSCHGAVYPTLSSYPPASPSELCTGTYRPPPYEHVIHSPGPSEHGVIPRPLASHYPPLSPHGSSYSAAPSQKPRHGTVSQYHVDEVTAGISGMGISGHGTDSSSYDSYRPQEVLPTSRPPPISYSGETLHVYPGYSPAPVNLNGDEYLSPGSYPPSGYPPEASNHGKLPASEYPSGYPLAGYLHSDSSSHGMYGLPPSGAYPPPHSLQHGPPSLSSYYPPHPGYPHPGQHDSYPPVPFYNAHPTHYVPAGYPK